MNEELILKRMAALRRDNNWTQKELAYKLEIGQATYSDYEKGQHGIPLRVFLNLAVLYHTSVDYLLGNTDLKDEKREYLQRDECIKEGMNRLFYYRDQAHKTKIEMAKFLKVTPKTYSRYENGKQMPPEVALNLAKYYHTSVDYLMNRTGDSSPYPPTD